MTGIEQSNERPLSFYELASPGLEEAGGQTTNPLADYDFPSLFTRVKAAFVDGLVMIIVFVLASYIIDLTGGAPDWVRAAVLITMFCLYEPILITLLSGTIGHHLMSIRVVRSNKPEKNLNIFAALFRLLLKLALGWLSFLTITSSINRKAIHDMASGSVVIDGR